MKKFFSNLFRGRTNEERMMTYLSQATDRVHLEYLQRQWDRMSYNERSMW
jgi:hypothetical protein